MSSSITHPVYIIDALVITPQTLPNICDGSTYPTQTFTATGGTPPYTWADISSPSLPTGLTFNPATQELTGTAVNPSSTYDYITLQLQVTDSTSTIAVQTFSFVIYTLPAITNVPTNLLNATNGTAYSDVIYASIGTYAGPASEPSLTGIDIVSGSLPTGLSLGTFIPNGVGNPNSISITGTPAAISGIYNFTAEVTDSHGCVGTRDLSITVENIVVSTSSLPGSCRNVSYNQTLTSDGIAPLTWSVSSGTLPLGLSIDSGTGIISGTTDPAATVGVTNFDIHVVDNLGNTTTKSLSIEVYQEPIWVTDTLPNCGISSSYSAQLDATGADEYTLQSGSLPDGLTISSGGLISGTSTSTIMVYNFTIRATSVHGCYTDKALSLSVLVIDIFPSVLPDSSRTAGYYQQLTTNGTAPYIWSLTAGELPPSLTLDVSTGVISGKIDQGNVPQTYYFNVKVIDTLGLIAEKSLSILVTFPPIWKQVNLGSSITYTGNRPPKNGEFILMGNLSYWSSDTLLQTNNRVLIYKDGYFIGEIQPNKIVGTDALFPISQDISILRFSILVDGEIVTAVVNPSSLNTKAVLTPITRDNSMFTCPIKDINSVFRIYKNLRLNDFNTVNPLNDYTVVINPVTMIATITFAVPPLSTDTLIAYEVNPTDTSYNKLLYGIQNGVNATFGFVDFINPSSVQLFQNGIHLKQGTDFNMQPDIDYTVEYDVSQNSYNVIFRTAPEENDLILADYQVQGAATTTLVTVSFTQLSSLLFSLPLLTASGNINVYKNGIIQLENTASTPAGVYTITNKINNIELLFNNDEIDIAGGDVLTITYEYTPLYSSSFITALNTIPEYIKYGVTASVSDTGQLQLVSNNTLDLVIPPLSEEEVAAYRLLFGTKYTLNPGKDTDGEFLYYIRSTTGEWKYSNLNLTTRKIVPFNTGDHLRARAVHTSDLNVAPSYLSEQVTVTDNFHELYLYTYVPLVLKDIKDA